MSDVTATPAVATAPAAPKLNAIQIIEREIGNFFKQREQAVANVHAVDGAIQASQHLLAALKAEAAKAEAVVEKGIHLVEAVAKGAETRVEAAVDAVEGEK